MQVVEAHQLRMLVLALPTPPMMWEPKTRPAPNMQASASTGMATAITKHLVPGPAWSPELGRREPALPCLQIQKTQSHLPASQAQSTAQGCMGVVLLKSVFARGAVCWTHPQPTLLSCVHLACIRGLGSQRHTGKGHSCSQHGLAEHRLNHCEDQSNVVQQTVSRDLLPCMSSAFTRASSKDRQHRGMKEAPTCHLPHPEVLDSTLHHPPAPQTCWDAPGPDETSPPEPAHQQSSCVVLLELPPSLGKAVQTHPPGCPQQPARKRSSDSSLTGYIPRTANSTLTLLECSKACNSAELITGASHIQLTCLPADSDWTTQLLLPRQRRPEPAQPPEKAFWPLS